MKDRIRQLRKNLGLNQTDFGERIGIKQGTVTGYETGSRTPTDAVILSICREFDVNEEWLRTGVGEMFIEFPEEDEYFKAATMISKEGDKDAMDFLVNYWKLDPASKELARKFLRGLSEK